MKINKIQFIALLLVVLISWLPKVAWSQCGTADFTISSPVCIDEPVSFSPANGTYKDVTGGGVVINSTHTFTNSGFRTVRHILGNDSCEKTVLVNNKPAVPSFNVPAGSPFCAETNVTFSVNAPQGGITYIWDFGDPASGTSNTATGSSVQHAFTSAGNATTYTVSLKARNGSGCESASFTQVINIKPTPKVIVTSTPPFFRRCIPIASSPETNFDFTFDNSGSISPNAVSYTWSWGDGSPNVVRNTTTNETKNYLIGEYTFKVTGTDAVTGCTGSFTSPLIYQKFPSASLSIPPNLVTSCSGQNIKVGNNSLNATNYTWIWGDGDSTFMNNKDSVNHTYNFRASDVCGTIPPAGFQFNIRLIARNNCPGFTHTNTSPINVFPKPKANFSVPSGAICLSANPATSTVTFNNLACPSDPSYFDAISSYQWNFGDPASGANNTLTTTAKTNPSHYYAAPGNYPVKLTVTNSCGSHDTTIIVKIDTVAVAIFGATQQGNPANNNTSNNKGGCNPNNTTNLPQITLPPNSPNNCASSSSPVVFNLLSNSLGTNLNYNWSASGGTGFTFGNPTDSATTISFTQGGTYLVQLQVTNPCSGGGSGSPARTCMVLNIPSSPPSPSLADIGGLGNGDGFNDNTSTPNPNDKQTCSPAQLDLSFIGNNTGITNYNWTLTGTGSPAIPANNTSNPGAVTLNAGSYTLNLVTGNQCGNSPPLQVPIQVLPPPNAKACDTCSTPPAGQKDTIFVCKGNTATLGGGTAETNVNYTWTALTSGAASPDNSNTLTTTVTNNNNGVFLYQLNANNGACQKNDTVAVKVLSVPPIQIGDNLLQPDTAVCEKTSPFTLKAIPSGGTWKKISGVNDISLAGTYNPILAGSTQIRYVYTSPSGCKDSVLFNITVNPLPAVSVTDSLTFCNTGGPQQLTGTPNNGTWSAIGTSPAAAITASGLFSPSVAGIGTFFYRYTFTNSDGCSNSDTIKIKVTGITAAAIPFERDSLCVDAPLYNLPDPQGGVWSGNGVIGNSFNPAASGVIVNAAQYNKLIYTIGGGTSCEAKDSIFIRVFPLPTINVIGGNLSVCADDAPITLQATPTGGTWSVNSTNLNNGIFNPLNFTVGNITATYSFTDSKGCSNTANQSITIKPLPIVDALANNDTILCNQSGATQTYIGLPSNDGQWFSEVAGAMTTGGIFSPSVAGNGIWKVWYRRTLNGCNAFDTIRVTITSPSVVVAGSDIDTCFSSLPFNLPNVATPIGGTWSVITTGATILSNGTNFQVINTNDSLTTKNFDVMYSYGVGTCLRTDTIIVTVKGLPNILPLSLTEEVCEDIAPINLSGFTPNTGNWAGNGVTSNVLNVQSAVGNITTATNIVTTYQFTDATTGCVGTRLKTFIVNPLPEIVPVNDTTFCDVSVGQLFTPNTGGTWLGSPFVNASGTFNAPAAGTGIFPVFYNKTDSKGCVGRDTVLVTIVKPDTAKAGLDDTLCISELPLTLVGYSPTLLSNSNGRWTITNAPLNSNDTILNGNVFNTDKDGLYTLRYTYGTGTCENFDTKTVRVNPLPIVNAGLDSDSNFCATDAPIILSNRTNVTPIAGGTWAIINGNSAAITNNATGELNPILAGVSVNTILYTFTDLNGCTNRDTVMIRINPLPQPNFSIDTVNCINTLLTMNNQTPTIAANLLGNPIGFRWDYGDGTPRTNLNTHTYLDTAQSVTIKLIATSGVGCKDSTTRTTKLVQPAVPSFITTINPLDSCGPVMANFTNTSTGYRPTFTWKFGLAANDSVVTTTYQGFHRTYQPSNFRDTSYYVSVSVQNLCGTVRFLDSVVVAPSPTARFSFDTQNECAFFPRSFYNLSYGKATSFKWVFGDKPNDTLVQFPSNNPLQVDSVQHAFAYNGADDTTYFVRLFAYNKCGVSVYTDSVKIYRVQLASVINSIPAAAGCTPLTVNFTSNQPNGTSNILTWFVNGIQQGNSNSLTYTFPANNTTTPQTYQVKLAVVNGCNRDTATRNITVHPRPIVDFSVNKTTACLGDTIRFTDNSQTGLTYSINYGDGTTSTLKPLAPKIYQTAGTYKIILTGTTTTFPFCSQKDSVTVTILNSPLVTANLAVTPNTVCLGDTVTFTNTSLPPAAYPPNGLTASYTVFFGDGNNQTNLSPFKHVYSHAGTYQAYLIAQGFCNSDTSPIRTITVKPLPQAQIVVDADQVCLGDTFTFSNPATNSGNVTYHWDFGNGTFSNLQNPGKRFYPQTGDYTVKLTVKFTGNVPQCQKVITKLVKVLPIPKADFVAPVPPTYVCEGNSFTFQNTSQNALTYLWVFNPNTGLSSTDINPTVSYDTSALLPVKLIAYNALGCSDTTVKNVVIYPKPSPDFVITPQQGCSPLTVSFSNTTVYPVISQGFLNWNLGNNNNYNGFAGIPNQVYVNQGNTNITYTVTLAAVTTFGCKDTLRKLITVYPTPKAAFEIQPNDTVYQNNAQVFFQNNVSLQGNWSYQWLFGDGADTTVNNKNLIGHYYDTVGKFPVTLYTQTNQGCKDSVTKYVTVLHVAPIAEFDLLDVNNAIKDTVKGCRPVTVHVNNKTQFADNFFWDFGNGVFYPVKNPPAVTYFNPGEYTIRLIARNAAGADTAIRTKVVKVYDLPIAAFRVNPEEIILPDKPVYTDNISIGGDNFYWNFGDGSAWKEGFEPEHIYQDTGTYTITMVAETRYGCLDTTDVQAQRKVKVRKGWAIAVPNAFTPAGSQVAQSEGLNDVFLPIVEGAIEYKLQIFNRWGEILFESKDVNVGWNGFHRGVLCTQDVYAWKIVATFSDGTQLTRIGDVTLLR